jgi:hypothetical protein
MQIFRNKRRKTNQQENAKENERMKGEWDKRISKELEIKHRTNEENKLCETKVMLRWTTAHLSCMPSAASGRNSAITCGLQSPVWAHDAFSL